MLIAIDGGGTKTEAILLQNDGHILNRKLGGPTNPNSVGLEESAKALNNLLEALLHDFGGLGGAYDAVFAGLSGASLQKARTHFENFFSSALTRTPQRRIDSDLPNALSGGVGHADGAVIIAGTGSSALARANGICHKIGGWGHMIDDAGSGFDIARKAFRAVLRAWDGRAEKTALTAPFAEKLGISPENAIPQIYQAGKQYMADFAPIVLSLHGDPAADKIIEETAQDLALYTKSILLHFPDNAEVPVVMAGSIWKNEYLRTRVHAIAPARIRWVMPDMPPVYGAAVEAAFDAGLSADAAFKAAFAADYTAGGR